MTTEAKLEKARNAAHKALDNLAKARMELKAAQEKCPHDRGRHEGRYASTYDGGWQMYDCNICGKEIGVKP